jgi:hypothetical protein
MRRLLFATLALIALLSTPARAALQLANYPDPQGAKGAVIPAAYAYIVQTNFHFGFTHKAPDGSDTVADGLIIVYIYRSADAADNEEAQKVADFAVQPGELLVPASPGDPNATPPVPPTPALYFPTVEQLDAAAAQVQQQAPPPGLSPFAAQRYAMYQALKLHPKLKAYTPTDVP